MSFTTFANLKLALAAWWKPNTSLPSAETTDRIPEYVALAEAEFNRTLKNREMEQLDTAYTITSGVGALPTGFISIISMRQANTPYSRILPIPMDQLEGLDPSNTQGPCRVAVSGTSLYTWPPTSTTARFRYRKALTALSADGDTNWLLTSHPDAYLYGSLRQADKRMVHPDRLALIEPGYQSVMRQLEMLAINVHEDGVQSLPSSTAVV